MNILLIILAVICVLDVIIFVCKSFGNASNFTYYICRPFFGLISGNGIGMVIGFIIRLCETAYAAIIIYDFVYNLL